MTNYKLMHNALPTNDKFKNRYDNKCYLCNKKLDENLQHLFVDCQVAIKCYEYIIEFFLINKTKKNSLSFVKYKYKTEIKDFRIISCYIYCLWRTRNSIKHDEILYINGLQYFKVNFNKWIISMTSI